MDRRRTARTPLRKPWSESAGSPKAGVSHCPTVPVRSGAHPRRGLRHGRGLVEEDKKGCHYFGVWLTAAFPEMIELDNVTLRRQSIDDAPSIVEAINCSREELRPWLPFANDDDAVTEVAQRQRLEQVADQWTNRTLFPYTMVNDDGSFAGFIEVRPRPEPGRVSIGYWLDQRSWGRGLVTKAAQALIDAALAIPEIDGVEIRCDQANLRSIAVAKRLDFALIEIRDHSIDAPGHSGRSMVWLKRSPKT